MSIKKEIKEFFKILEWPDLEFKNNEISIPDGKILELKDSEYYIDFYWYNYERKEYGKTPQPQIIFKEDFNIRDILNIQNRKYYLKNKNIFKAALKTSGDIKKIKIEKGFVGIRNFRGTLKISPKNILKLTKDLSEVNSQITKHRSAITSYLVKKVHNKYLRKRIGDVTTIVPGSFEFLVDRFNIKTKKTKKDYKKVLNKNDIYSLELLTEALIKNKIFSKDYLKVLDDYFIKEKLTEIIELGRKILALKTNKLNVKATKEVIKMLVEDNKGIKQFENIWQKYFEKNLLYLVFSYKKFYPKIKLEDIEGDKKHPDFIGINHYNGIDVIEIKTHLTNVLVWDNSHKNFAFSHEMSKAITQTMNYLDAIIQKRFKNPNNIEKITEFTDEENLYHPKGIIVISSYKNLTKTRLDKNKEEKLKRDFTKLRNSLQNLSILTFDEVLQIADDYIKNIRTNTKK